MKAGGLTQPQTAELLGVSLAAVKKWLTSNPEERRAMPQSAYEMLQLHVGRHPKYRLAKRRV